MPLMLQARATLSQYENLQSYEIIRAPFDGIMTARNVDPGHLVPGRHCRHHPDQRDRFVARLKPLRVFTYVPQNVALFMKNGNPATITVNEYPGREFTGSITRHPEALAPDSRTMLVEVDLPNDDLSLYPGMYGMAKFVVSIPSGAPLVPDDALVFRDNKVYVPLVRGKRLHLAEVTLGYDNGVVGPGNQRRRVRRYGRAQRRPGRPRSRAGATRPRRSNRIGLTRTRRRARRWPSAVTPPLPSRRSTSRSRSGSQSTQSAFRPTTT